MPELWLYFVRTTYGVSKMRCCEEPMCNGIATKKWDGKEICYDCYDVISDQPELISFGNFY